MATILYMQLTWTNVADTLQFFKSSALSSMRVPYITVSQGSQVPIEQFKANKLTLCSTAN